MATLRCLEAERARIAELEGPAEAFVDKGDYVARIKSVPAVRDPDTKRSASQWALAERLRVRD